MPVILYFTHEFKWKTKDYQVYVYEENQHYKRERLPTPKREKKQKLKIFRSQWKQFKA